MPDELKAQDCELEYWNQQAEDYAQVQIPCEDLRAIINRAWEAPAFNSALTAAEARAEAAEARVGELEAALTWFLDDPRFQVAVGGNPDVVERMITEATRTLKGAPDER